MHEKTIRRQFWEPNRESKKGVQNGQAEESRKEEKGQGRKRLLKMNVRQQKYKVNRLSGMSAYQAAIKAGYKHNTALHAHQNIEKRIDFKGILIKHGLDDESLVEIIKDGVSATKTITGMKIKLGGEDDGLSNATSQEPDWNNRHKFVETALKLTGRLNNDNSNQQDLKPVINIINNYGNSDSNRGISANDICIRDLERPSAV